MALKSLNDQHKKFVREYVLGFKPGRGFNCTQAAIAAGYSQATADKKGSELLNDPLIQKEIKKHQKRAEDKTLAYCHNIVSELCKLGFSNIKDCFGDDGELISPDRLPDDVAAAVSEYTVKNFKPKKGDPYTEIKYSFHDKRQSLMDIAKLLGFLRDKGENPNSVTFLMNIKGQK